MDIKTRIREKLDEGYAERDLELKKLGATSFTYGNIYKNKKGEVFRTELSKVEKMPYTYNGKMVKKNASGISGNDLTYHTFKDSSGRCYVFDSDNDIMRKIDINSYIKECEIVTEMNLDQLYGDLKSARAKALNLVHVGYGNWKNPARESFKWDDTQKLFVKIKSDEQKDTNPKKDTSDLQVGDRIKLVGDTSVLKGNEYFVVQGSAEKGNNINGLSGEKGYKLRSSDNSKPLLLMWIKAKNDPRFEIEYVGPKKIYDKDGKWINKDPDSAEQKIKNQIKTKLEEPEDDYEIEKSGEDYGQKKMVSKNWAISYSTGGRYNTFEIYGDLENIGKRGKMVKSVEFTINSPSMGRTAWASTIEDAILLAKPKTFEELVDFMNQQTDIAKNTESEVRIYKNPVKEVKGVYSHIPDFGLEGDFESVQGADVGIKFSKPDIKIDSSMDSKEADKGHMRRFIEIKWTQAKKVNAIKDQLKSVVGLNNVAKVLTNNKIKFKTHSYMDGMYN